MATAPAELSTFPRVAWEDFATELRWRQGEHALWLGHTGSGKTTALLDLAPRFRKWVAIFATKPKDRTLEGLLRSSRRLPPTQRWHRIRSWDDWRPTMQRVIVWPKYSGLGAAAEQRAVFREAMAAMFRAGAWCLVVDDVRDLCSRLRLQAELVELWLMARANDMSVAAGNQRPAFVPLEGYSQSTHVFMFRENDRANLKRLGEMGGAIDSKRVVATVEALPEHDMLYINTRTGDGQITRVER